MVDIVLAVFICVVTLATAYLGVHVTLHPADSKREKLYYKLGFLVCSAIACALIGVQSWRTDKAQKSTQAAISTMSSTLSVLVGNKQTGAISISDKQIFDVVMLYLRTADKSSKHTGPQMMIAHGASGSQTILSSQIKTILSFAGIEVAEMTLVPGRSDLPITIKGGSGINDPEVTRLRLAMSILGIGTSYAGAESKMYLRPGGPQAIILDLQ